MLDYRDNTLSVQRPQAQAAPLSARLAFDPMAFFLRWWPLVLVCAVLGMGMAFVVSKVLPPRFTATAQIYVDPRGIQLLDNELTPRQQDSNAAINFVESQVRIITSQSVLSRVVETERLFDDPEFVGAAGARWARDMLGALQLRRPEEAAPVGGEKRELVALGALYDRVSIRRPERTFVIEVIVRANAPDKAARLANAVAQAYLETQAAARSDTARRATQFLTSRLDDLREKVRKSEERAEDFRRANGLVGTRDRLVSEQQLTESNTQLGTAQTRLAEAQARFDQVQSILRAGTTLGSLNEAVISPTIASLRGQQSEARRRLADVMTEYGPRHPTVRNIQAQVADIDRGITEELQRIAQSARLELDRARGAEASLRRKIQELSDQASNASQAFVQLRELQREVDANRNLLASFLNRSRETGEFERIDTSNTRIITVASPPRERTFPPRAAILLAIGFALGVMLGLALAIAFEFLGHANAARRMPRAVPDFRIV